jgi:hypothetical protein
MFSCAGVILAGVPAMKPIKINRQLLANSAPSLWERQYADHADDSDERLITDKLKALGDTPNPDDIDNIIGNTSWTSVPKCDCCGELADTVVRVGEEPDYESSTAHLCQRCVEAALEILKA